MALRRRRYRRRAHRGDSKLHPAIIVGICLAAAVLVTLVVGNLLTRWLDDDTFHRLTVGDEAEEPDDDAPANAVRAVNAYPFSLDEKLDVILGKTSASVSLNSPEGEPQYCSDMTRYLGFADEKKPALDEKMQSLVDFIPYVSGVFYSNALSFEGEGPRFAAATDEAALMREFVRAGGSELLIFGLPIDDSDAVISYLESLRFAVGDEIPIGVAVPLSVASSEYGWYYVSKLLTACDFCAIDVTDAPTSEDDADELGGSPSAEAVIASADYYVSAYRMRLILSERQALLLGALERRLYENFQVVTYFEPQQPLPEGGEATGD